MIVFPAIDLLGGRAVRLAQVLPSLAAGFLRRRRFLAVPALSGTSMVSRASGLASAKASHQSGSSIGISPDWARRRRKSQPAR